MDANLTNYEIIVSFYVSSNVIYCTHCYLINSGFFCGAVVMKKSYEQVCMIMERDWDCIEMWYSESLCKWCTHTPLFFQCLS